MTTKFNSILNVNRHKFNDEITRELKHTGAGILSMANSGEFCCFILYKEE